MATVSRTTTKQLPEVFQTERNKKFLNATLDQFTQKGELEKISGFVGSKKGPSYKSTDTYFTENTDDRQSYQLEPSVNYKKDDGTIDYYASYVDLINQIEFLGGNKTNHHRLFEQQSHSWAPPVDIDPLINYRHYYWLPEGPSVVQVDITRPGSISTIKVTSNGSSGYNFSGYNGDNPVLTLYRGNTYKFEVDAKGHPFYIKTSKIDGSTLQYETDYVTNQGQDEGTVTFSVPESDASSSLPDILFYSCGNHTSMQGSIVIEDLEDGFTTVDITTEVLGKKEYTTPNSVVFENGLKIKFAGTIPANYKNKEFYVEGVGDQIVLMSTDRMIVPETYSTTSATIVWDADGTENFDENPWDAGFDVPKSKDYFTINRNSKDFNAWSRSNRWFHESVLTNTATYNGHTVSLDQTKRAKRPIIQFEGNIQLYNYGEKGLPPVTAIETNSSDAFSFVNGQLGYYIDGVDLKTGDRVIFQNDSDTTVKSNIYEVDFVTLNDSTTVLYLDLKLETIGQTGHTVIVKNGTKGKGKQYRFDGTSWVECQQKTKVQQTPLFDLYNNSGVSLNDSTTYPASSFSGNTLFEVAQSTSGTTDTEYGLKIKYENFGTVADITFNNTIATKSITYLDSATASKVKINTESAYYKKNIIDVEVGVDSTVYTTVTTSLGNMWTKQKSKTKQRIIDVIDVSDELKSFKVKTYDNASSVVDLELTVFVNNVKKTLTTDYTLETKGDDIFVKFVKSRTIGDKIVFESYAPYNSKNDNGYYEVPDNLERNGLNSPVTEVTLGELSNHVLSITDNLSEFSGTQPGSGNLKDIVDNKKYGRRIMQHEGSIPLATYSLTHPNANFYSATKYVAKEYTKFKNSFIKEITTNTKDGEIRDQVDAILKTISANKSEEFAFYHSDMIGWGENYTKLSYTVTDNNNKTYGLSAVFDKTKLSEKAVHVWVNDVQVLSGTDYNFDTTSATLTFTSTYTFVIGDKIEIREYDSTIGSHVPPTPTKLGLYPSYEPKKYVDDTYRSQFNDSTAVTVIQGHDGSLIKAYGDIRDDLILDFEKRIYNNIKVTFDETNLHDLHASPGNFRKSPWTQSEWDTIKNRLFLDWTGDYQIDYTTHSYFDSEDSFTWNYSKVKNRFDGTILKGYWRGIYRTMYDTDRPHTHPWEMLGFSAKPSWWETRYGAAPYTSGNLILWQDLENGFIYSGSRIGTHSRYARNGLSAFIPVDSNGDLRAPNDFLVDRIIANQSEMNDSFEAGDGGPAETSWIRSSDYPFAVQIINALTSPARYFGVCWDTARIFKNSVEQYVYTTTGTAVQPKNFVFYGDTYTDDNNETQTYMGAGLHVWIVEYLKGKNFSSLTNFITPIKKLRLNLSYKLGGLSDKTNLKAIADAVSPGSKSNSVFIPQEDYQLFLNTSSPIVSANYSGVIVQVTATGYKVIGYDPLIRSFKIYAPIQTQVSGNLSIGQTSDEFSNWQIGGFYGAGSVIKNDGVYYRVNTSFTAGSSFDETSITEIGSTLPLTGGVTVAKYTTFHNTVTTVPYGTEYKTVQEVANFIQGYEKWLVTQGFKFDAFSSEMDTNTDWSLSIKEFMFWSTQNWATGTVIALSPSSQSLVYENTSGVIDTLLNPYEGYLVMQQEGIGISINDINVGRNNNTLTLSTRPDSDGIYFAKLNVVQKEHIVLFENSTVFADVIYDPSLGFRQERLKLTGFKTSDWNGDLFAPGFVYDEAKIGDWTAYNDYNLGDVVKYQTKYYVANQRHSGTEKFINNHWTLKDSKPTSALLPNFDYKTAQFEDFYNLDTDNFDEGQQNFARHLIGYQPRQYLEDLGIAESSQYKFYQGFIREKGTINSITKMLNAQFRAGETNTYNVYEEWAFRTGNYGGKRTQEDIEYKLESDSFHENPQLAKFLIGTTSKDASDPAMQINKNDLTILPTDYNGAPFIEYDSTANNGRHSADSVFKFRNAGPVPFDKIDFTALDINDLITTPNVGFFTVGDYIWIAKNRYKVWDLYRVQETGIRITRYDKFESDGSTVLGNDQVLITTNKPHGLADYDLVILSDVHASLDGIYQIPERQTMDSTVSENTQFSIKYLDKPEDDGSSMTKDGKLLKLVSMKFADTSSINTFAPPRGWLKDDIVTVTNDYETNSAGRWVNYENTLPYIQNTLTYDYNVAQFSEFGHAIAGDKLGYNIWISAPGDQGGKLYLHTRSVYSSNFDNIFGIFPSHTSDSAASLTGTLTVTNGSTSVTGAGTLFVSELAVGDRFRTPTNKRYTVVSIESNTALTIEEDGDGNEASSACKKTQFDRWGHAMALASSTEDKMLVSAPFASGFVKVVTLESGDFSTAPTYVVGNTIVITHSDGSTVIGSGRIKSWNSSTFVMAIETDTIIGAGYMLTSTSSDGSTTTTGYVAGAETILAGEGYAEILNKDSSGNWGSIQTVTGNPPASNENFGTSVAISGDSNWAIFGVPGASSNRGRVEVYKLNTTTNLYEYNASITPADALNGDKVGYSVATNKTGSIIAIGAPFHATTGLDSTNTNGAVFVFSNSTTGTFDQIGKLVPNTKQIDLEFGYSVAMSEDASSVIVGAPGYNQGTSDSTLAGITDQGKVFYFKLNTETFTADGSSTEYALTFTPTDEEEIGLYKAGTDSTEAWSDESTVDVWNVDGSTAKITFASAPSPNIIYTVYRWTEQQGIISNAVDEFNRFGEKVVLHPTLNTLAISSKNAVLNKIITFDKYLDDGSTVLDETTFDMGTTRFVDPQSEAGNVRVYSMYGSYYVMDQLLSSNTIDVGDKFGTGVAITNRSVFVGATKDDTKALDSGLVIDFDKGSSTTVGWEEISSQDDLINPYSIKQNYLYDTNTNRTLGFFDWIDPIKGKLPGPADAELKFISDHDPALYNELSVALIKQVNKINLDTVNPWRRYHVGELWLDTSKLVYQWYEQGTAEYRNTNWGKLFPGSTVDVYEWVESDYTPDEWRNLTNTPEGDALGITGRPRSTLYFSSEEYWDIETLSYKTKYYYWVRGTTTIPDNNIRRLSAVTVENLIGNPKDQGYAYMSYIKDDAVSYTNLEPFLSNTDVVHHTEWNTELDPLPKHDEWILIKEGDPDSKINAQLKTKLIDSLVGSDAFDNNVPDADLPVTQRYGIDDRQSMVKNRTTVLTAVIENINEVLAKHRIVSTRNLTTLNDEEKEPTAASGNWNIKVDSYTELGYINTQNTPSLITGTKVLITTDSMSNGYWAIYTYKSDSTWERTRIQTYDTTQYWQYKDWYLTGYDKDTLINHTIATEDKLLLNDSNVEVDETVKITTSFDGKFRLLLKTDTATYKEIGLGDATIEVKKLAYSYEDNALGYDSDTYDQYNWDQQPIKELRSILSTVIDNVYIDDLKLEWNKLWFFAMQQILAEQLYVDWIIKTSFLTVENDFKSLSTTSTYKPDPSDALLSYVDEVKPFHTKVRQYNVNYAKTDTFGSDITDFDNEAYWDKPTTSFKTPNVDDSAFDTHYASQPGKLYNDNYTYIVSSIIISKSGSEYTEPPIVTISGGGGSGATATAYVSDGKLSKVTVTNSGSGYITTPTVTLTGGGREDSAGIAAKVYAQIDNAKVRNMTTTLQFNRLTGSTVISTDTITEWTASTDFTAGQNIRYNNEIYYVVATHKSGTLFTDAVTLADSSTTTNITAYLQEWSAVDYIKAHYSTTAGMPGVQDSSTVIYGQLMTGLEYPGTKVIGPTFDTEATYDAAGYDAIPYDGQFIDDEGIPTPSYELGLDKYVNGVGFTNSLAGTNPSDVITEGNQFVDEYSAHAPEEVVPGTSFDTLDMQVYTNPSMGSPIMRTTSYVGDGVTTSFAIGQTPADKDAVFVWSNGNLRRRLNSDDSTVDYTITNNNVNFVSSPASDELITIQSFSISGSKISAKRQFTGDGTTTTFNIPIPYSLADSTINLTKTAFVTVDGVTTTPTLQEGADSSSTDVVLSSAPVSGAIVQITLFDADAGETMYSQVNTQVLKADGSTLTYALAQAPATYGPLHNTVIVERNGTRLNPPDTAYYSGDGTTYAFNIPTVINTASSVSSGDVEVYVNGARQTYGIDWFLNTLTITADQGDDTADATNVTSDASSVTGTGVVYFNTRPSDGEGVAIVVKVGHDYIIEGSNIVLQSAGDVDDEIRVTSFTNHDQLGIRTEMFKGSGLEDAQLGTYQTIISTDPVTTTATTIDTWNTSSISSVQYFITSTNASSNTETTMLTVTSDGTNVGLTKFGTVVATGASEFMTYNATIGSGVITVTATSTDTVTKLKAHRMSILATSSTAQSPLSSNQETFTKQYTSTGSNQTTLFELSTADYTGAEIFLTTNDGTSTESAQLTIAYNGTTPYVTEYNSFNADGTASRNTFAVSYVGTTLSLKVTNTTTGSVGVFGLASKLGTSTATTNNTGLEFVGSTAVGTSAVVLDSFDLTTSNFDGAYYQVLIKTSGGEYEFATIHVAAKSGNVSHVQYGQISSGTVATFNAILSGNTVQLEASGASSGNTAYVYKLGFDTAVAQVDSNRGGYYTLSRTPTNTDYLWVTFNGDKLIAGTTYSLQNNQLYIPRASYSNSDVITVTSISTTSMQESVGYRVFKDMINRTHYKRIADANNTKLAKALDIADIEIFVNDASILPAPDQDSNTPGIIFINKERITYFTRDTSENSLGQIMRGTLGTGAVNTHPTGTNVIDAGATQTIPGYSDTTTVCSHSGDGSTVAFSLYNADSTSFIPKANGSDVSVFIGGIKQTSGFTFDGLTAVITFTTAPESSKLVEVIRKTGKVWVDQGTGTAGNGLGLQGATGPEASFLLNSPTKLP